MHTIVDLLRLDGFDIGVYLFISSYNDMLG